MSILKPFQLLEINVISAQDLEPVSRKMKTYATAWIHPKRKLSSRVDSDGHVNPTWNDKFVFRVDEDFLRQDTSAVQIELYASHWFRHTLVGTVRVLVGNLIPPPSARPHHHSHVGMRFVALQVRRPSGRPQGILNIGVTLLDSSMRSMPMYTQLSASAVGYRDFMGEDENHLNQIQNINHQNQINGVKPILRRSKSDRSVMFEKGSTINSSIVAITSKKGPLENDGSILSISNEPPVPLIRGKKHTRKASSVISGAELREKPKEKGRNGKASSVVSDSIFSKDSSIKARNQKVMGRMSELKVGDRAKVVPNQKPAPEIIDPPAAPKAVDEKSGQPPKSLGIGPPPKGTPAKGTSPPSLPTPPKGTPPAMAIGRPIPKLNGHEYGAPRVNGKLHQMKPNSLIWSDSEVGPSPSEVAAAMAERRYPLDEERSSVLDGWSLDESVEGLRSKLERWRTELPPIYDRGYGSSSVPSTSQPTRRHSDGGSGSGMFSCFGNIYGYECQCICGKPPARKGMSGRYRSPSNGSRSFF